MLKRKTNNIVINISDVFCDFSKQRDPPTD